MQWDRQEKNWDYRRWNTTGDARYWELREAEDDNNTKKSPGGRTRQGKSSNGSKGYGKREVQISLAPLHLPQFSLPLPLQPPGVHHNTPLSLNTCSSLFFNFLRMICLVSSYPSSRSVLGFHTTQISSFYFEGKKLNKVITLLQFFL